MPGSEAKRFQVLLALARDALFVLQALLLHGTCKMLAMCMRVRSLLRGGDAAVPGVGLLPQVQHREAPRPLVPGHCTTDPNPKPPWHAEVNASYMSSASRAA